MTKIIKSEIKLLQGGGATMLKLELAQGAKIKVQLISLRAFSDGIVHYDEQLSNQEKRVRKLIGESTCYDIVEAKSAGWVILSRERPSALVELDVPEIFAAVTSFFASEIEMQVEAYEVRDEKVRANCEAGNYWQRYKNPERRKFFLGFDCGVIPIPVGPGEAAIVYHGYWLAMEGGMQIKPFGDDVKVFNRSEKTKMLYIRACNRPW